MGISRDWILLFKVFFRFVVMYLHGIYVYHSISGGLIIKHQCHHFCFYFLTVKLILKPEHVWLWRWLALTITIVLSPLSAVSSSPVTGRNDRIYQLLNWPVVHVGYSCFSHLVVLTCLLCHDSGHMPLVLHEKPNTSASSKGCKIAAGYDNTHVCSLYD